MKKVKFTAIFGVKRPGDVCEYDNSLTSQLVNVDKVAEYTEDDVTEVVEGREYIEPSAPVAEDNEAAPEEEVKINSEEDDVTEVVAEETVVETPEVVEETPAIEEVIESVAEVVTEEVAPEPETIEVVETPAEEIAETVIEEPGTPAVEEEAIDEAAKVAPEATTETATAVEVKPADEKPGKAVKPKK